MKNGKVFTEAYWKSFHQDFSHRMYSQTKSLVGLAIELMKEYYGAMLDRGATTFWEDFHMEWLEGSGCIDEIDPTKKDIHGDYGAHCYVGFRHSLCHGWSAGVAKFIKEHCHE